MPPLPVVIDTDPGIDDLVALTLALRSPELEVVAVTATYGNAPLDRTVRNLRTLLGHLGRDDIPILPGADRPLVRLPAPQPDAHGPSGVGHAPVPEASPVPPDPLALCRALATVAKPVTVVTLGPLTNLAAALAADPAFVRARVMRHVGMFGCIGRRARPERWADFNAWADPEALAAVLRSDLNTVMMGFDVTRDVVVGPETVASVGATNDAAAVWIGRALAFAIERQRELGFAGATPVHDVLPIVAVIDPDTITLAERRLTVDLDEGDGRGRTVESADGTPVTVATAADPVRTRRLLQRVLPTHTPHGPHDGRRRA